MPTREQMDRIISGIEVLMAGLDVVCLEGEQVVPASPEKGECYFWEDLTKDQRLGALTVAIDWEGFTETQRDDVIRRVLDDEHMDFWMDGIRMEGERPIRPLTQQLIDCCELDVWPSMATIIDFGLKSSSHLGALQYAIREELVTPAELDVALGKGDMLTEIAQRGENPYRFVTFRTAWDDMRIMPEKHEQEQTELQTAARQPDVAHGSFKAILERDGNPPAIEEQAVEQDKDYER